MEKSPHKIRTWLADTGRKSRWLATQCGVNEATLSLWLSGKQTPLYENRAKLAELTGMDVTEPEGWA
jgi:hypothetical protein